MEVSAKDFKIESM